MRAASNGGAGEGGADGHGGSGGSRAARTVAAAAAGVTAHVGWQLGSRVLSFLLRAAVVRTLGPSKVAATELDVTLVNLAFVMPITGFRKVTLRAAGEAHAYALSALCVLVTAGLGAVGHAALAWLRPAHAPTLAILGVALVVRAAAEPAVIFTVRGERYAANSRARAVAVLSSGVAAAVAVHVLPAGPAAASGHLVYSLAMLVLFRAWGVVPRGLRAAWREVRRTELAVAALHFAQAVLKYLLGNGQAFVLAAACARDEHGAYILAGNIASIVLRFFHDGLEDQCFNVFQRLAPAFPGGDDLSKPNGDDAREAKDDKSQRNDGRSKRNEDDACEAKDGGRWHEKEAVAARQLCVSTLHLALKASLLVSSLFAFVGPSFSYAMLRLVYGTRWTDTCAPRLLALYFIYLLFTALNGVTEAFIFAAGGSRDSKRYWVFSAFLAAAYLLALRAAAESHGAAGVICVNCANMALRAAYTASFYCARTKQSWGQLRRGASPRLGVLITLLAARAVTLASEGYWMGTRDGVRLEGAGSLDAVGRLELLRCVAGHGSSGVLACAAFIGALAAFAGDFARQTGRLMRGKALVKSQGGDKAKAN